MSFDFGDNLNQDDDTIKQFNFFTVPQLKDIPMPKWLIPDLLFQRQIALLYGAPGTFKSFVCIDLMLRLAHGMEWQGRPLKAARVLYVAGEGFPMFYARCLAWFKHHGIEMDDRNFVVVDRAVNLTDPKEVLHFIRVVEKTYGKFDVTVFDTFSTCTAGQNECDSAVATTAIEHSKLIGSELGGATLLIHHPGKNEERGSRGHSSLLGNIDAEWHLERRTKDMNCKMTVTKQKDAPDRQEFHFRATAVKLGLSDEFGDERIGLALSPYDKAVVPGDTLTAGSADRICIASCLVLGTPISMNLLAEKLMPVLNVGKTKARERTVAALTETWIRTRRGDDIVEIRIVPTATRKVTDAILVEMRLAEQDS